MVLIIEAKKSFITFLDGHLQECRRQERVINMNLVVNRCYEFITVSIESCFGFF
jgi:hypothetical protein